MIRAAFVTVVLGISLSSITHADQFTGLVVESKIPLGAISGRIDHLAIDIARQRLYVAELGNDSVGVVDLGEHKVIRTLTGFSEPQGIAYVPTTDAIYVSNGGDGSVRIINAANLAPNRKIDIGEEADNVRFDADTNRVYVGYGHGAIAVIDPVTGQKIATIQLKGHPESFQIVDKSPLIFLNIPETHEIATIDSEQNSQTASRNTLDLHGNFAMAIDNFHQRIAVAFRHPAKLNIYSITNGTVMLSASTCKDADDVFVDRVRERLYVSCGEGFVDIFELQDGTYHQAGRFATVSGARTSLYVPELDRLFVAARATLTAPAAIWVLRPNR